MRKRNERTFPEADGTTNLGRPDEIAEFDLINWIRDRTAPHPQSIVGPGDDCAVLDLGDRGICLITADALVEGVHFNLSDASPEQIGHKAVACSLSDIAAMGCEAVAAVVTVVAPSRIGAEVLKRIYEGMRQTALRYAVTIAGGDLSVTPGPLTLSGTVVGRPAGAEPVLRSGAQGGDVILVTGELGGASRGRHLRFEPRLREGLWLNRHHRPHAMIDISDGLAADLRHILAESGLGAVLRESAIPISEDARALAAKSGETPIRHALGDGEDFELLFSMPPERAEAVLREWPFEVKVTRIGETAPGNQLLAEKPDGERYACEPSGWEHKF